MLLSREDFRTGVFERDRVCVVCGLPAADAHHLIERRLWPDGGYYLDNGVALCEKHHIDAEKTLLSVEKLRSLAGITKVIVPPHLYSDHVYDKWGNNILPDGKRTKGELFNDPSVQLALKEVLYKFTNYVKYPRTYHLPWSDNVSDDDKVLTSLDGLNGIVVATEKMDGENTTLYKDYIHARSIDGRNHPSRGWVKNFWSSIAYQIPDGWRVCGENLYASHTFKYDDLPSYFLGFSIWDENNICLSWKDTLEWFELLGIVPVSTIYVGEFNEDLIKTSWLSRNIEGKEGYVVRAIDSFHYKDFRNKVGKYVVKFDLSTRHWQFSKVIPNKMRSTC